MIVKIRNNLKLLQEHFTHANIDYIVKTSQLNAINGLSPIKKLMNFSCEQSLNLKVKAIRTNNESEFINENLKDFMKIIALSMKK